MDGLSVGLVMETVEGFQGVDAHGGASSELSFREAAWQVRVNC